MGQIGIDLSLAANRMLDAEGKGPHLFVDALLLSQVFPSHSHLFDLPRFLPRVFLSSMAKKG
eukprot:2652227-Rhodomonas_salina.1